MLRAETLQLNDTLQLKKGSLALPAIYLATLTTAFVAVGLAVGTEYYAFIPRPILYRLPFAQLESIYYVGLFILAVHYAVYWAHFLKIRTAPFAADRVAPQLRFSVAKFLVTWVFLLGLFGTYALGAAIATPELFDPILGDAQLRIWLHQFFGLVLIVGLVGGLVYYCTISILQQRRFGALFSWIPAFLNLRKGHRFIGVLNWLLFLALLSNLTTGLIILGAFPLTDLRVIPFLPYSVENTVRIMHDIGTSLMVGALIGHGYFRLLPENRWMLRTMFGGDEQMPT